MPQFTVSPLSEARLADAYPLVRTFAPHVSFERWMQYAHSTQQQGGVLGLYGADDTLFGVLTYRCIHTLQHDCVMLVDNFVTFELSRSAPGRKALCEAAEALAEETGCTAIELVIGCRGYADGNSTKAQGWRALGHQLTGVVFRKELRAVARQGDHKVAHEAGPGIYPVLKSPAARRKAPAAILR